MFRGFDSSIMLILRGGIPRPMGDFPESLSQAMLVEVMLVGRLGVQSASQVQSRDTDPEPRAFASLKTTSKRRS